MTAAIIPCSLRMADFAFTPDGDVRLQPYAGSAWRGAFGFALKRLVCAMRMRPCEGCPLAAVCLYPRFFGVDSDNDEPRPYILAPEPTPPGGWVRRGQMFRVRLTLLGGAEAAAPYAIQAVLNAAAHGLTNRRVPFACVSLTSSVPGEAGTAPPSGMEPVDPLPPSAPPAACLRFATPLRLRLHGDLVTGRSLTPAQLVGAVLRRVRLLGIALPEAAVPIALEQARALAWQEPRFGWLETTRRSSRQQACMQLGGIVGEARLDLKAAPDLWPLLRLASILHVGKSASMGFGRIELRAE